jgi:hypothetical protein
VFSSHLDLSHHIFPICKYRVCTNPIELGYHADTCTLGTNYKVISYTDKDFNVSPYHPDYPAIDGIPILQAAIANTDSDTSETFILVVNQGLYMCDMLDASFFNPNRL